MTIQLIVTDMDETFLREDKTYDKEKATFVFNELKKQDVVLGIASGNFIPLLENYFDEEFLEYLYLAGDDGNVLKKNQEIIRTLPLNREEAQDIYHFINKQDGYHPVFSTGNQAYTKTPKSEWAEKEIRLYFGDYQSIENFSEIPNDQEIVKIEMLCDHPLDEIKEFMKEIEGEFSGVSSVTSGDIWLDIYHKEGGKGEAVKFLQNKYNISPQETMCFGDSLNDRSMMQEAYYSVAMMNADQELKEHCRYEIGSSEDQAVLTLLEKIITAESLDFLEQYRH
jgi:hypothetical protein